MNELWRQYPVGTPVRIVDVDPPQHPDSVGWHSRKEELIGRTGVVSRLPESAPGGRMFVGVHLDGDPLSFDECSVQTPIGYFRLQILPGPLCPPAQVLP